MARGEYDKRVHSTVILASNNHMHIFEEAIWKTTILCWILRYQSQNSVELVPLRQIRETLNLLAEDMIYTYLNVTEAYNVVAVKEGDEHKMPFQTRYWEIEPLTMQFGTSNAPAEYQGYINDTIWEALDDFASAYLDDILVYSNLPEEPVELVMWVMNWVIDTGLYLKPEKWEFLKETVKDFGLIISTKGISMDPDKVSTVCNLSRVMNTPPGWLNILFEVQQFLGFYNYYRRFNQEYSPKAEPFTRLTRKDELYVCLESQQQAFECMIEAFTPASILQHLDHERHVVIKTDASHYNLMGVLF